MYYAALLKFHPGLLAEKLKLFLADTWTGVEQVHVGATGKSRPLRAAAELPRELQTTPVGHWILCQRRPGTTRPIPLHASYHYNAHNHLEELDAFLHEVARRNAWAVLPWGTPADEPAFAFLTTDQPAFERFLRKSSNIATFASVGRDDGVAGRMERADALISSLAVSRSLADVATVALASPPPPATFWDLVGGQGPPPDPLPECLLPHDTPPDHAARLIAGYRTTTPPARVLRMRRVTAHTQWFYAAADDDAHCAAFATNNRQLLRHYLDATTSHQVPLKSLF